MKKSRSMIAVFTVMVDYPMKKVMAVNDTLSVPDERHEKIVKEIHEDGTAVYEFSLPYQGTFSHLKRIDHIRRMIDRSFTDDEPVIQHHQMEDRLLTVK